MIFSIEEIKNRYSDDELVRIEKYENGKNASLCGAFSTGAKITFVFRVHRILGASGILLDAHDDDSGKSVRMNAVFVKSDGAYDSFSLTLDTGLLCAGTGLIYYSATILRGNSDPAYIYSKNNRDVLVCFEKRTDSDLMLLIYDGSYSTPEWFRGALMYHVFVDRFRKGADIPPRADVTMCEWGSDIVEYGKFPGDFCKNDHFFGGDLYGVIEKLDYLESLGISVIYLSPIFKAYSNHKYDTGDYENVDEMFGGNEALKKLIKCAHMRGMRIILDGVFNHTGDDSKYFNRYGRYDTVGAYQSRESEYHDWFSFEEWPDKYRSWWGIEILPALRLDNKKVEEYFLGDNGIVAKYLKMGVDGFRLDVADELPDSFLDALRRRVKSENPDALIIGEVWENAASKIAYGKRRRYFQGGQLDSVMNYPIKCAIIDYVLKKDTEKLYNTCTELYSSYPPFVLDSLMNILSTHDTDRILTVLSGKDYSSLSNDELAHMKLSGDEYALGKKRLMLASVLQYTLFGSPSLFYADEAGASGAHDPFCRVCFPWDNIDKELHSHYALLGRIKRENKALQKGDFRVISHFGGVFAFLRAYRDEKLMILANVREETEFYSEKECVDLISGKAFCGKTVLEENTAYILKEKA